MQFQRSQAPGLAANRIYTSVKKFDFGNSSKSTKSNDLIRPVTRVSRVHYSTLNLSTEFDKAPYSSNLSSNYNTKKVVHFSNRDEKVYPRTALKHSSVFLDPNRRVLKNFDPNDEDVPDENIDGRSFSRVSDSMISRGSITNRLALNSSIESPFSCSFTAQRKRDQMPPMYKSVANFQQIKIDIDNVNKDVGIPSAELNYQTNRNIKKAAPSVPTTEFLTKAYNAQKLQQEKLLVQKLHLANLNWHRMVEKLALTQKMSLLLSLRKIAIEVRPLIRRKKQKIYSRQIKHPKFTAIVFLQRAFRARKQKFSLKKI